MMNHPEIPLSEVVDCYRQAMAIALNSLDDDDLLPQQRRACWAMIESAEWLLRPLWDLEQYAEEFPRKGIPA